MGEYMKRWYLICGGAGSLLATACGVFIASGGKPKSIATSDICSVEVPRTGEYPIELGTIFSGERVTKSLRFQNTDGISRALSVHVDCGCTNVLLSDETIPGKGSIFATVSFDSSLRSGSIGPARQHFVILGVNGTENSPVLTSSVSANIVPSLVIDPSNLVWDPRAGEVSGSGKELTVRNESEYAARVSTILVANTRATVTPSNLSLLPHTAGTVKLTLDQSDLPNKVYVERILIRGVLSRETLCRSSGHTHRNDIGDPWFACVHP
jgi:hypothetical protein